MVGVPDVDVARASLFGMNEMSRRAEAAGLSFAPDAPIPQLPSLSNQQQQQSTEVVRPPSSASRIFAAAASLMAPPPPPLPEGERPLSRQDTIARLEELQRQPPSAPTVPRPPDAGSEPFIMPPDTSSAVGAAALLQPGPTTADPGAAGTLAQYGTSMHEGLQVFTLGHLLPRSGVDDVNGNWTFDPSALQSLMPLADFGFDTTDPSSSGALAGAGGADVLARPPSATLRVRRSTFVPGWSVPPRVLLVEDDAVSRKLSSKFLQVFGCTTDVAVDGEGAVNMMNLAKYDLVLMVSSSPGEP
jgi:osomolarity two-component system, response regulator SKN7